MNHPEDEFIRQLTSCQNLLFSYIYNLLGDLHHTRDVLQQTNVVMWKKNQEFEPGTNFKAWAHKCAYYEALSFLRDHKRDRHVFDEELVHLLAEESEEIAMDEDERLLALRHCLAKLPRNQRHLIDRRYRAEVPVRDLAAEFSKKESAIKMLLMRTRDALATCIETKLAEATK